MPYVTLREQVQRLHNPQRSDTFVKQLRAAVRDGTIMAAELPARFELPKAFTRHGSQDRYRRSVRDMVIDATPQFGAWFEIVNRDLSPARSGGRVKVSQESVEAGLVDFLALAAETRRKLGASFAKGQALSTRQNEQPQKRGRGRPRKTAAKREAQD